MEKQESILNIVLGMVPQLCDWRMKCINMNSNIGNPIPIPFIYPGGVDFFFLSIEKKSSSNTSFERLNDRFDSLEWQLDSEIENEIENAYKVFKEAILNNETATLNFTTFGGNFIKGS